MYNNYTAFAVKSQCVCGIVDYANAYYNIDMDTLDKIRRLQGERGWTDYKLAQEAQISTNTLSSLFLRNSPPKLDTLQCICNAFGLTLAQFFLEDEKIEVLSETEKAMLQIFRKLSPKQQKALISVFTE